MGGRGELTETAWETRPPLLPANGGRGWPWRDHRQVLHGIRGTLRTGASGRDLPDRDGPWRPVAAHSARWREATWDRRLAHLQTKAGAVGEIEGEVSIDRTTVRAHQHAAGARTKGAPRRMRRPAAAGTG